MVDDNATNRCILQGMLTRWEMLPTLAEDAEHALLLLAAAQQSGQRYRLILTDMYMPKMDGFALIERIRERPEFSTATIVMLTSAGHQGDAARCQELGVAAYLLKPIRQSELREAVARAIGLAQTRRGYPANYAILSARCARSRRIPAGAPGRRQRGESAGGRKIAGKARTSCDAAAGQIPLFQRCCAPSATCMSSRCCTRYSRPRHSILFKKNPAIQIAAVITSRSGTSQSFAAIALSPSPHTPAIQATLRRRIKYATT